MMTDGHLTTWPDLTSEANSVLVQKEGGRWVDCDRPVLQEDDVRSRPGRGQKSAPNLAVRQNLARGVFFKAAP
jgi:hypothetical protein